MKTRAREDLTDLPLEEVLAQIARSEKAYANQERINQAKAAKYPPYPPLPEDSDSDSDLTDLDEEQHHFTMSIPPIPKFQGRDDPDWLDTFEIGMMDRGKDADKAYMAKYFSKMMTRDTPAETWYAALPADTKANYDLLKASWKTEFQREDVNKADHAITKFLSIKLPDVDI
jgi:hypothetical protein